ncbi:MAG TPA: hypothetical protein VH280_09545 [Verrucomicrobiae bacterium]|nr:hypothetical protein [Verrucomicrobiae bacterium]
MKALFALPGWRPKTTPVLLACLAAAVAGCGKASTSASTAPSPAPVATTPATPASTAPVPTAQPMAQTASTNSAGPTTLQSLNRAMVRWMRANHRRPRNFQEFASTANVQIPDPPPGKKYALNGRGFIILVDNSTQ